MITAEQLNVVAERKAAAYLKTHLRDTLMKVVYGPPELKLTAKLDDLLARNGTWCLSFRGQIFKNSLYVNTPLPPSIPRVQASVAGAMTTWFLAHTKLEEEKLLAGGSLTAVLNAVSDHHDFYKIFPECMHDALREFFLFATLSTNPRPLTEAELTELISKQDPYLQLFKQRMVRTLVSN
jgi:hypothetical protein